VNGGLPVGNNSRGPLDGRGGRPDTRAGSTDTLAGMTSALAGMTGGSGQEVAGSPARQRPDRADGGPGLGERWLSLPLG
jgi:hypothetical protein